MAKHGESWRNSKILHGVQGVASSNPATPTNDTRVSRVFLLTLFLWSQFELRWST